MEQHVCRHLRLDCTNLTAHIKIGLPTQPPALLEDKKVSLQKSKLTSIPKVIPFSGFITPDLPTRKGIAQVPDNLDNFAHDVAMTPEDLKAKIQLLQLEATPEALVQWLADHQNLSEIQRLMGVTFQHAFLLASFGASVLYAAGKHPLNEYDKNIQLLMPSRQDKPLSVQVTDLVESESEERLYFQTLSDVEEAYPNCLDPFPFVAIYCKPDRKSDFGSELTDWLLWHKENGPESLSTTISNRIEQVVPLLVDHCDKVNAQNGLSYPKGVAIYLVPDDSNLQLGVSAVIFPFIKRISINSSHQ